MKSLGLMCRLRNPDPVEKRWPELATSRRMFLPLLGMRAVVSAHFDSFSGHVHGAESGVRRLWVGATKRRTCQRIELNYELVGRRHFETRRNLNNTCRVDPIPNRSASLDIAATSLKTDSISTETARASQHISQSVSNASRLSRP